MASFTIIDAKLNGIQIAYDLAVLQVAANNFQNNKKNTNFQPFLKCEMWKG